MRDTIYRQQAIEYIDYLLSNPCKGHTGDFVEGMRDGYYRMRSAIKYLPSAQPERKKGRLLYHHTEDIDEERTADVYFCSTCKEEVLKKIRFGFCGGELDIHYGFCPICGADMRGDNL